jgi:DNA-binding transcriptional LysR family regulator
MELRQLQYLVDVVDEGSFTKAAAKAHVAQPGVSAQVRRLERELGHPLLDRSGGRVRPTDVGAAVLPYARAALSATADVRHTVDALSGLVRGHLSVGSVASISTPRIDLPGLLADFHRRHRGIEISLTEASTDRLVEALRGGSLDIALIGLGAPLADDVATRLIASEPLVAVVAHDHPLAGRKSITLDALSEHSLIALPAGTGLRARLDAAAAAAGLTLRIAFEAGDPHLLGQLASRGLGAAVLPRSAATAHAEALHVLTLTRPRLQGHIALAWRARQQPSPAARAFLAHAARAIAPADPGR